MNKILEKAKLIKEASTPSQPNNLKQVIKEIPFHSKLGLGISSVGLGLGIANFRQNNKKTVVEEEKAKIEAQSLSALQKIHKALTKAQKPIV